MVMVTVVVVEWAGVVLGDDMALRGLDSIRT